MHRAKTTILVPDCGGVSRAHPGLSPRGIADSLALGVLPYFTPPVNYDAVGTTPEIRRFPTDAKIPNKHSPILHFKIGLRNTVPATGANHSRQVGNTRVMPLWSSR